MHPSAPGRRRRFVAAAFATLALLASGCSAGGSDEATETETGPADAVTTTSGPSALRAKADEPGSWTVFVYMAADNNLEGDALADLREMATTKGTEYVVLVDRAPGYSEEELGELGNFEDTALLHIEDGNVELLDSPGELNTGDVGVFEDFIATNVKAYPNDHQALVVWNHGGSWRGAAWDESSEDDNIDGPELAEGIGSGLEAAGIDGLDLIGFDACLMATYEIATTVAPYAAYLLGSEETEPGDGWDWTASGAPAAGLTAQDLGQAIIDAYAADNDAKQENDVTLSLLDLTALPAVDDAAALVASSLEGDAHDLIGRIGYGRSNATGFGRDPNPENDYFLVDLGDLATNLAEVEGMEEAGAALADAVEQVVVTSSAGPAAARASGIAAYFPSAETYHKPDYDQLALAPAWNAVLEAYYDAADDVADDDLPVYLDEDRFIEDDEVNQTDDTLDILSEVGKGTGGNILFATLHWGEVDVDDTDYVTWFGERNAEVDGDQVSANYDWRYLTITDGQDTSVAYADLHVGVDRYVDRITIPILYVRGEDQAEGRLELSVVGGSITSETFYVQIGEGISALKPEQGDGFFPLLKRQSLIDGTSEWVPSAETPLYASADDAELQYRYDKLPPANAIMVGLGFTDVMGTEDWVYHGTASP